jgi:hypothetical protein
LFLDEDDSLAHHSSSVFFLASSSISLPRWDTEKFRYLGNNSIYVNFKKCYLIHCLPILWGAGSLGDILKTREAPKSIFQMVKLLPMPVTQNSNSGIFHKLA